MIYVTVPVFCILSLKQSLHDLTGTVRGVEVISSIPDIDLIVKVIPLKPLKLVLYHSVSKILGGSRNSPFIGFPNVN